MTLEGSARGTKRTRRGKREMRERYIPIDIPFPRSVPQLEHRHHGAAEIEVNSATAAVGNSANVDSVEGGPPAEHRQVNAVVSTHLEPCTPQEIAPKASTLLSSTHDSIEHALLDDRLSLCVDTEADTLLGDEIFYRDEPSQFGQESQFGPSIPSIAISSPPDSPDQHAPDNLGDRTEILEHPVAASAQLLDWQSLLALLLCGGTVKLTVNAYEFMRKTLIWQASKLGSREGALPGIRKIQRVLMPLMRTSFYARSSTVPLRKNGGGTEKVCVVLPSVWAKLDIGTTPLYDALFGPHSRTSHTSGPSFLFDGIENTPIVRQRSGTIHDSRRIFVAAVPAEEDAPFSRLPTVAGPGDRIKVKFSSNLEAEDILGLEISEEMGGGLNLRHAAFTIIAIWDVQKTDSRLSGETPSLNLFDRCRTMKPGDTVVHLNTSTDSIDSRYEFILLYRFRRLLPGEAIRQLYFIPKSALTGQELDPALCTVSHVRGVELVSRSDASHLSRLHSPSTGHLMDGRRYVTYRVLLYCDDFQPHSSTSSSYGGCYMLPMGIPPAQRAGYGAVRCIGLTPPQVSTNEILHHIIPDLVKCSTIGVPGLDPNGNQLTIFIDVLGFIGDYPAVSHALDVLGHNSRAPCHLCCFVRQDRIGQGSLPYYGHTTKIHSRSTAFSRSVQRMQSLRAENSNAQELSTLGFKPVFNSTDYPLHALSSALSAARPQALVTDRNEPVVPAIFDPYRSALVAPDHLLFGLAQDILRATIALCTPQARQNADVLLRSTLSTNSLTKHRQIINPASASINAMSMSDLFAVLLIAPICFESGVHLDCVEREGRNERTEITVVVDSTRRKKRRGSRGQSLRPPAGSTRTRPSSLAGYIASTRPVLFSDVLGLLKMFQRLVRDTHFWPCAALDGATCMQDMNRNHGGARLDFLYSRAVSYVSALHDFCVRDNGGVAKYLNKPNLHRLLELYTHTIPAFGHSRHIQELLFETAHQPLKRAIARSNQRDPHIQAVTATLANDWECRLSMEVNSCGDPASWADQECARIGHLIAGRDVSSAIDVEEVRSVFCEPILSHLRQVRTKLLSSASETVVWIMEFENAGRCKLYECWRKLSADNQNTFNESISHIKLSTVDRCFQPDSLRVGCYASSSYENREQANGRRRAGSIYAGSVVQALVAKNDIRETDDVRIIELQTPRSAIDLHSSAFQISFWLVLGLFQAASDPQCEHNRTSEEPESLPYAVVLPCSSGSAVPVINPVRVNAQSSVYILPLSQSIREAICVHACAHTANCTYIEGTIKHSGEIGNSTPFYVLGRQEGYPSRTA